jgi:hypothetical protein
MSRAGSEKAPIRGIAKLLLNLSPGLRTKIESAFVEAENLLDFHNRSVVSKQTRREISGLVSAPIVTVTQGVLGVAANWNRLDDPRITLYEVEVSSDDIFSDPTSFNTLDTNFSIENRTAITYMRVRGVRADGKAGPWSEGKSATPNTVPVSSNSVDVSDLAANPVTILTDAMTTIQEYNQTIQSLTTAAVVFGSLSVDIPTVAGGESSLDAVIRLNGRIVANYGVPTLDSTTTADALESVFIAQTGINAFLRPQETGGTAVGFGPAGSETLTVSKFEDFSATDAQESGAHGGGGTPTGWSNIQGPTLNDITTATYVTDFGAGSGSATTKFLELFDFDFNIPSTDTIVGVEVHIRAHSTAAVGDSTISFDTVQLRNDSGTITGNNNAAGELVPQNTTATYTYGGATDLWGLTLTPAIVNDADFGFAIKFDQVAPTSGTVTSSVLVVTMCVYTSHSGRVLVRLDGVGTGGSNGLTINNATINVVEFASENV